MDPAEIKLPFFSTPATKIRLWPCGFWCFGLMESPLNPQISCLLLDVPIFPYLQGEPGYVLGGVEVIPGRNGQPGPPVSIQPQVLGEPSGSQILPEIPNPFLVAGTEGAAGGSWGSRTTRISRATRNLRQGEFGAQFWPKES